MRVLFVHGLASSGAYKMASMLRQLLKPCEVIAPDLPLDPEEALALLKTLCARESPELVVGLSWGAFLSLRLGLLPTVAVNPDLHISRFLRERIGPMDYLSPRSDGETQFEITEEICLKYEEIEKKAAVLTVPFLGCFADNDEVVRCRDEFESLYPGHVFTYPGGHLPTFLQMKTYLVPAIREFYQSPSTKTW